MDVETQGFMRRGTVVNSYELIYELNNKLVHEVIH